MQTATRGEEKEKKNLNTPALCVCVEGARKFLPPRGFSASSGDVRAVSAVKKCHGQLHPVRVMLSASFVLAVRLPY